VALFFDFRGQVGLQLVDDEEAKATYAFSHSRADGLTPVYTTIHTATHSNMPGTVARIAMQCESLMRVLE
jgi:hypothetical protein